MNICKNSHSLANKKKKLKENWYYHRPKYCKRNKNYHKKAIKKDFRRKNWHSRITKKDSYKEILEKLSKTQIFKGNLER